MLGQQQQAEKNAFLRRYIGSICKLNFRSMQDEAYRKVLCQFRRWSDNGGNKTNKTRARKGASSRSRHESDSADDCICVQEKCAVDADNDDDADTSSRPWFIEKELPALKEALPQLWRECHEEKHAFVNKIRQLLAGTLYSSATAFIYSIPYASRRGLRGRHRCAYTGAVRNGQFTIRLMTSSHAFGSLEGKKSVQSVHSFFVVVDLIGLNYLTYTVIRSSSFFSVQAHHAR